MEIKRKANKPVLIEDVAEGKCFEYNGSIYMKLDDRFDAGGEPINTAADLSEGLIKYFKKSEYVRLVNAKVVVK